MAVPHPDARRWYAEEASREMWSIRTLDRNIGTQYYAEFLNFKRNTKHSESDLEQALIDNLEQFIMELGRGFAFVERQKHIVT